MSRKNFVRSIISEGQSLASSFQITPTTIKYLDNLCYQINISTTDSEGTFEVQGSLDYDVNNVTNEESNSGAWVPLNIGGTPTVSAANDTILIDMNQLPFNAIRLVYSSTVAGTGTCDIWLVGKEIG